MAVGRAIAFVATLVLLTVGLHRYVYLRLVRDLALSPPVHRAATFVVVLLGLAPLITLLVAVLFGRPASRPFTLFTMSWFGLLMYVVLTLLGVEVVRLVASFLGAMPDDPARRAFLARGAAGLVAVVTAGLGLHGLSVVGRGPVVRKVTVPLRRHRGAPVRVVQLTDVHVGPTIHRDFVLRVVEKVNALEPDVVVITGDLVDGSVEALRPHVAPLAGIRARHGVFFVTGNHEYYSGADAWIAHLRELGIRVLRNERVAIGGDEGFDLAGVDDFRAHEFGGDHGADLEAALAGRDATRPVVLLAHQPKQAPEAKRLGVDLQLSGHTHGGQLRPFDLLVRLDQPYVEGLYRDGDFALYVSPGTGYWGPPMRIGTRCEITELTVTAG